MVEVTNNMVFQAIYYVDGPGTSDSSAIDGLHN